LRGEAAQVEALFLLDAAVEKDVDVGLCDRMVVVRLGGAFGGKRMLAVEDLWLDLYGLRTPFAAWQVEDSPALSDSRHAAEDPYRARSYWRFAEPETFYAAAA